MATPRAQINQVFQLGPEGAGTPGVGGTVTSRLGTFNSQIAPVASGAFGVFRPSGGKYVGQVVPTDIYAEGAFTDTIDFNTIPFLFAGNVGYVAATGVVGTGVTWRHTPTPYAASTAITYVAEEGQAGAVYNYRNVLIPDLNLRFMRNGASQIGGRVLGKTLAPDVALTSGVVTRAGRSISSIKTGVWEAADWATLLSGSARLAPVALDVAWRHNGVFAPWFALDDSVVSFAGTLDQPIDAGVQISILADVDVDDIRGAFNYASMQDGTELFIKVLTTGPLISVGVPYSLMIDMCLTISGPPRRANVGGGLRVWQWDTLLKPNSITPFLPFDITVVNTLAPAALVPA